MKWILLLLCCSLPLPHVWGIESDEYKFAAFDVSWKTSTNMALGNQSADWSKLKNLDTVAAHWVACFWFTKCRMENHGYWTSVVNQLKSKSDSAIKDNPKLLSDKQAQDKMIDEIKANRAKEDLLMLDCFVYDHAPEIAAMIAMRLELANNGQSSTLKATKAVETDKRNHELQQQREDYFKSQKQAAPKGFQEP